MLGLDIALQSAKKHITHLAIITGDSDLIPAIKIAKEEGVATWLFHGPRINKNGYCSYANELWQECDERFEMKQPFIEKCKLVRK